MAQGSNCPRAARAESALAISPSRGAGGRLKGPRPSWSRGPPPSGSVLLGVISMVSES